MRLYRSAGVVVYRGEPIVPLARIAAATTGPRRGSLPTIRYCRPRKGFLYYNLSGLGRV